MKGESDIENCGTDRTFPTCLINAVIGKWPTTNSGWRESFVAEGFDGIEAGGAGRGVESCDKADDDCESDGA